MEGGINMSKTAMKEALMYIYAGNSDMAIEVLEMALKESNHKELTLDEIKQITARVTGIEVWQMESKSRKRDVSDARALAMYACREFTTQPLAAIGMAFGDRDHSTVFYALEKAKKLEFVDKNINTKIKRIREIILEKGENTSC
jgi:chromosomal replication initiator protein